MTERVNANAIRVCYCHAAFDTKDTEHTPAHIHISDLFDALQARTKTAGERGPDMLLVADPVTLDALSDDTPSS